MRTVLKLTKDLVLLVKTEKFCLVPTQELEYLGADYVHSEGIVKLPASKCNRLVEEVMNFYNSHAQTAL